MGTSTGASKVREKELQEFILARIELALDGRTWAWLARTSGTPKSTLATQAAIPRFSVEVLAKVSSALGREIEWFFPKIRRRRVP